MGDLLARLSIRVGSPGVIEGAPINFRRDLAFLLGIKSGSDETRPRRLNAPQRREFVCGQSLFFEQERNAGVEIAAALVENFNRLLARILDEFGDGEIDLPRRRLGGTDRLILRRHEKSL